MESKVEETSSTVPICVIETGSRARKPIGRKARPVSAGSARYWETMVRSGEDGAAVGGAVVSGAAVTGAPKQKSPGAVPPPAPPYPVLLLRYRTMSGMCRASDCEHGADRH